MQSVTQILSIWRKFLFQCSVNIYYCHIIANFIFSRMWCGARICVYRLMQKRHSSTVFTIYHYDVIKCKRFPRYWPFVRGIHRSPVNSPQKGQWCGALIFSLICVWINGWVNNREAGDLRRYRAHYDVTVMYRKHLAVSADATTPKGARTSTDTFMATRLDILEPFY